MLPFGIGFSEVLVVMVVILLVIGPNKLPDLAKTLGKGVRAARRAGNELKQAISIEDEPYQPPRPWMQQNSVSDAESELITDENWACDGEGGTKTDAVSGVMGTVARADAPLMESDTSDGSADEASEDNSDEANRVDG